MICQNSKPLKDQSHLVGMMMQGEIGRKKFALYFCIMPNGVTYIFIYYRVQAYTLIPQQTNKQTSCWGKEQRPYSKSQQMEKIVDQHPKEPFYPSQNSGFFGTRKGRGVISCCKLLGAESFVFATVSLQVRSKCCYKLPSSHGTNLILCSTTCSLFVSGRVLNVQALRMGYPEYFRL